VNEKTQPASARYKVSDAAQKWLAKDWVKVLIFFLLTRLIIHFIAVVGMTMVSPEHSHHVPVKLYITRPDLTWGKWDVNWYERIAREGYNGPDATAGGYGVWAFMPLYPTVVGVVSRLVNVQNGYDFFYLASLMSNLFSYAALLWLYKIYKRKIAHPDRFLKLFLVGCGTFYLSIPYTESLYLLLIAAVIELTDRKWFIPASIICGLALVTRIQGAALFAIPFFTYWVQRPKIMKGLLTSAVMGILLTIPLGIFSIYLKSITGDSLAWMNMQSAWNNPNPYFFKSLVGFVDAVRGVGPAIHAYVWALYILIVLRNLKKLGLPNIMFSLGVFAVSTSTEIFYGANRFVLALVPVLSVLTDEKEWVRKMFIYSNLILLPIYAMGFVGWKDFVI